MNYAIVLSGGVGSRVGLNIPKQYYEVNGKSILQYVIETIEACEAVNGFVIVAEKEWKENIQKMMTSNSKFIGFAQPGANRQLSIYSGLVALKAIGKDDDRVLVQDAARPNTSMKLLADCLSYEDEYDGAMPVLPMKDTVYISKSGKSIEQLIDRSTLWAGQAPEAFTYGRYLAANEALLPDRIMEINGSSEPAIMAGLQIKIFEGDEKNYKITTEEDLARFIQQEKEK